MSRRKNYFCRDFAGREIPPHSPPQPRRLHFRFKYQSGILSLQQLTTDSESSVRDFVDRWEKSGSAERANYTLFLTELCDLLNVPVPSPR